MVSNRRRRISGPWLAKTCTYLRGLLGQIAYEGYVQPIKLELEEAWKEIKDLRESNEALSLWYDADHFSPPHGTDVLCKVERIADGVGGYTVAGIFDGKWSSWETQQPVEGTVKCWRYI